MVATGACRAARLGGHRAAQLGCGLGLPGLQAPGDAALDSWNPSNSSMFLDLLDFYKESIRIVSRFLLGNFDFLQLLGLPK